MRLVFGDIVNFSLLLHSALNIWLLLTRGGGSECAPRTGLLKYSKAGDYAKNLFPFLPHWEVFYPHQNSGGGGCARIPLTDKQLFKVSLYTVVVFNYYRFCWISNYSGGGFGIPEMRKKLLTTRGRVGLSVGGCFM